MALSLSNQYDASMTTMAHSLEKQAILQLLIAHKIKDVPTTSSNPKANTVCEHMHRTVGNIRHTFVHVHLPQNVQSAAELVDSVLFPIQASWAPAVAAAAAAALPRGTTRSRTLLLLFSLQPLATLHLPLVLARARPPLCFSMV